MMAQLDRLFERGMQFAFEMTNVATRYSGKRPELGFDLNSYPEMSLFRLERWATIQFIGALRLVANAETTYVAEVVLRGLLENLAHVWWIQQGKETGDDSRQCRALRMEVGMASELSLAIEHAAEGTVPEGSAEIAKERLRHMTTLFQEAGCKGKARKYGSVAETLAHIDSVSRFGWLHELWSVGSMVAHQGMLDRIMRDMGDGTTVVGEPATLIEQAVLLERTASVYGLIGRQLLGTNSADDIPHLDGLMGEFKSTMAELHGGLGSF